MLWRPEDPSNYAYLLGLYLGDGHVSKTARTYQLRLSLDGAYPAIVERAAAAVRLVVPHGRAHLRRRPPSRVVIVEAGWKRWPEVFPQHGPGRKHTRRISLEPWQQVVVDVHPCEFVRGLIESDGCRVVNRFSVRLPSGRVGEYAYPRYFFSNLSADIRDLFRESCARMGVRTTQSNARNISVSDRRSVAILDRFVGEKM